MKNLTLIIQLLTCCLLLMAIAVNKNQKILGIAAFIFPFFGKKGHYCAWMCPMGSCQELLGRIVPYNVKISPKTIQTLTEFREMLWILIMAIMCLGIGFELLDYELFAAFLFEQASVPLLVVAMLFAAMSMVVQRPYCRFITKQKGETSTEPSTAAAPQKTLFDETSIGPMQMKNRFVRASVSDPTPNGKVTDKLLNLYESLAKGGVGTILTGYTVVGRNEKNMNILAMYDGTFIEGGRRLTDLVHSHGSNILMQLVSVGSGYSSRTAPDGELMGASAVKNLHTGITPKEMTEEDIRNTINEFAAAALRAKQAGFDGVEIHACHGYLLHQFATPYYNRRTDNYGGSRENRYRLTIEVYEAIRRAVGEDFPVWIKVQSEDHFEQGVTHEDCLYLCRELAKRRIDAIEVSGPFTEYKMNTTYFKEMADKIARETSVPVIVTGGNRIYEEMEKMINETAIDYVGMARPLMTQPDLINQFAAKYKH